MKREIKKQYKTALSNIRQEYLTNKTKIKIEYDNRINDYYNAQQKRTVINPPKRSVLEEIGNAVTHGLGAVFAIVVFILTYSASKTPGQTLSSIVYSIGMFLTFIMSSLYHSFAYGTTVKRLFRRFDYSSIYLLIGATFVPILLIFVGGAFGTAFFIIQWTIITIGITFVSIFGVNKLKGLHFTLYLLLGWSGLIFLPQMAMENLPLLIYILGGGIIYTLGIIPFALKKGVSHFIWHFFVLVGAIVQWIGIYTCLY